LVYFRDPPTSTTQRERPVFGQLSGTLDGPELAGQRQSTSTMLRSVKETQQTLGARIATPACDPKRTTQALYSRWARVVPRPYPTVAADRERSLSGVTIGGVESVGFDPSGSGNWDGPAVGRAYPTRAAATPVLFVPLTTTKECDSCG